MFLRMTEKKNFQKHITTNFLQIITANKVEKNVVSLVNLSNRNFTSGKSYCRTCELFFNFYLKLKEGQNKLPKF